MFTRAQKRILSDAIIREDWDCVEWSLRFSLEEKDIDRNLMQYLISSIQDIGFKDNCIYFPDISDNYIQEPFFRLYDYKNHKILEIGLQCSKTNAVISYISIC